MRNKLLTVILALSLLAVPVLCASADSGSLGDVNDDGKITAADARTILRTSAQLDNSLNDEMRARADANLDGKITAADARLVLRVSAQIDSLPEAPTEQPATAEKPTTEEPTSEEPTSEEPTSEEPTSEEPTSEESTSEEPTSEEPAIVNPSYNPEYEQTDISYDELPEQVKTFMSGKFGFRSYADGDPMVMYTDGNNINMSMTTEDMTVEILVLNTAENPECYIRSNETMKYHKLSSIELKAYDLSIEGITGSFDAVDPSSVIMKTGNVTSDGTEYTVYALIDAKSAIEIYTADGEIESVVCYDSDGAAAERIDMTEFYTEIPDSAFSLDGYKNSLSLMSVFI